MMPRDRHKRRITHHASESSPQGRAPRQPHQDPHAPAASGCSLVELSDAAGAPPALAAGDASLVTGAGRLDTVGSGTAGGFHGDAPEPQADTPGQSRVSV